ncbi:MAG: hypothetical protein RL085_519 [Actinomycetota bacterium]
MHRLSKLSLANRSVVALMTAIIAIFGFVSLGSLKQELIPSIETPQAAIVTTYIGASPEVIDKQVSQPIDEAMRALDGLVSSTTTSQSNISIVRVEFDYGTPTSKVTEKINAALAGVTLPGHLERCQRRIRWHKRSSRCRYFGRRRKARELEVQPKQTHRKRTHLSVGHFSASSKWICDSCRNHRRQEGHNLG